MKKTIFPFTAIIAQERMKRALILNAINPKIGGLLIRGEKGTAKSTAVRALADLLPAFDTVEGCRFNCNPHETNNLCRECEEKLKVNEEVKVEKRNMKVVELPVSATEDRVVGTIDIEHALKNGEKKFEVGILAQGNRNILYVDEVNLLDDHIVDVLLDAAAMGVNTVEREGVSYAHPSNFVLVGTMNPEEGDLRPQFIDRFGLSVEVMGEENVKDRMNVIKRRLEYERDPIAFCEKFKEEQNNLTNTILKAKENLQDVKISDQVLELIALISITLEVDGHRADITMIKTALTIATLEGRKEVEFKDVKEAANLVFPHRLRKRPFDQGKALSNTLDEVVERCREQVSM
ncbi:MAG: magnesium chelatase ATPase subunit I [Firmicutes bacterium]|nr:magnesium chelatase ATPase subunit I [Bacillota bacterium]